MPARHAMLWHAFGGGNSAMAGRIWFDVTTMMRWRRPPVGIVRVERECARAMLLRRPDAISFCLTENGRLVQIEPLDVKRKLAADVSLLASHGGAPADSNQLTFRRILGAVRRRIIAAPGRGHDRRQDAAINEGDVYLSMGLDWDD